MMVQHAFNPNNGVFYIEIEGKQVATMSYVNAGPGKFIIDHTEVAESQAGKGLGKLLVKAAVDYARENNLKIMPLCPYAKSVFDKTPEYGDVRF